MKNSIKKGGTEAENTILIKIRKNMFKDQMISFSDQVVIITQTSFQLKNLITT